MDIRKMAALAAAVADAKYAVEHGFGVQDDRAAKIVAAWAELSAEGVIICEKEVNDAVSAFVRVSELAQRLDGYGRLGESMHEPRLVAEAHAAEAIVGAWYGIDLKASKQREDERHAKLISRVEADVIARGAA